MRVKVGFNGFYCVSPGGAALARHLVKNESSGRFALDSSCSERLSSIFEGDGYIDFVTVVLDVKV